MSQVLRSVRLSGAVFFRAEMSTPWGVAAPPFDVFLDHVLPWAKGRRLALFHTLAQGECVCTVAGHPPMALQQGDVVLLVDGAAHALASSPDGPVQPAADLLPRDIVLGKSAPPVVMSGGGGKLCRILCGAFLFDGDAYNPILDALPGQVHFRLGSGSPTPWLRTAVDHVVDEAEAERPGASALLERLTELLFVELVREYMRGLPEEQRGWLAGLRDPIVGRTLSLLHGDPSRDWTVDELARSVGVARSKLAARFAELMEQPPIKYLNTWRLHEAARLLVDGGPSIAEVAAAVGYESESSFNRAFKRQFGASPARWARRHRAP